MSVAEVLVPVDAGQDTECHDDEYRVSHGTSNTFRDGTHSVPPS
jgi:hypothetical protein